MRIIYLFVAICMLSSTSCIYSSAQKNTKVDRHELQHLCTSIVTFPFSRVYLTCADGGAFNYTQIGGDAHMSAPRGAGTVITSFDNHTFSKLRSFNDGMQTRLVLGSMPRNGGCIAQLRERFGLPKTARIAIHSMNLPFECGWGGVSAVAEQDRRVDIFHYPTVDECAPPFIDTLRLLKRLVLRDEDKYDLHYVHCLAGRGRSATMIIAYIMCCLHRAGIKIDPEQTEAYLKMVRPQVAMSSDQKKLLYRLYPFIQRKDGLEGLWRLFSRPMERRDAACSYAALSSSMKMHAEIYTGAHYCIALLCSMVYLYFAGIAV